MVRFMPSSVSPGQRVLALWRSLSPLPFGSSLFMLVFGRMVPYSGALGARVRRLEPGRVQLELADRRGVRNHLDSIHAVALVNLGELASGLAMTTGLPASVRGIVLGIDARYLKKARGTLSVDCEVTVPEVRESTDFDVHAEIRDAASEPVARVTVRWRLGPVPPRA
jgi:acyl-coenzyme A thioesterase PaaI-like protein